METTAVMIRLEPKDWKRLKAAADDLDLSRNQLMRKIMREWLDKQAKRK